MLEFQISNLIENLMRREASLVGFIQDLSRDVHINGIRQCPRYSVSVRSNCLNPRKGETSRRGGFSCAPEHISAAFNIAVVCTNRRSRAIDNIVQRKDFL